MTDHTHIYDRFKGYTLEDCACEFCLHHDEESGCKLEKCCCEEERQAAQAREQGK